MSSLWHAWTHGPSHQFSVSNQLRWRLNRRASHSGATRNIFHTLTGFVVLITQMLGIVLILFQRGALEELFKGFTGQNFWQKTCRKLDLGSAESCESDYHRGFSHFSNTCRVVALCLVPMADIWTKHKVVSSNTYSLIHFGETHSKKHIKLAFFVRVYGEGHVGRTKLMAFTLSWQFQLQ